RGTPPARARPLDPPPTDFDAVSGRTISASVGGRVSEVCCQGGDGVRSGEVLVRFDLARIDSEISRVDLQEKGLFDEEACLETVLAELDRQEQAELRKLQAAAGEAEEAL